MPRHSREKSGTGIYHVMLRGINRQDIFEDEDDYRKMIFFLRGLVERTDDNGLRIQPSCHIYAYCLMSNHLHLLVKEKDEGVSDAVKRIGILGRKGDWHLCAHFNWGWYGNCSGYFAEGVYDTSQALIYDTGTHNVSYNYNISNKFLNVYH